MHIWMLLQHLNKDYKFWSAIVVIFDTYLVTVQVSNINARIAPVVPFFYFTSYLYFLGLYIQRE